MSRRRPSPVRLRCRPLLPERELRRRGLRPEDVRTVCQWSCTRGARVVRFKSRENDNEAIVHPSTKRRGRWQLTWIDPQLGPVGDMQLPSCTDAVRELSHRRWRLVDWRMA